ncbi:MAG: FAD-dependent oxidoreductase [Spirochaetes bacterium]|nr:FAD-dependent oxidoreductase [Spirochaetota bacterium]
MGVYENELWINSVRQYTDATDAVAMGCRPIDVHPDPNNTYTNQNLAGVGYTPKPYQIPYGCLVPKSVDGLLTTGRCISATREGMGSSRVMATCMALGEAAGTAAAMAARQNLEPRHVRQ